MQVNKYKKNHNKLNTKTDGIFNFMDYKKPINRVIYYLVVGILSICLLLCMFPIIWLFASSFKDPTEVFSTNFKLFPETFSLTRIKEAWEVLHVGKYLLNSLIVVLGSTVASVIFNGLFAYVISVLKPKGYKIVYAMVMATLMIPAITNMRTLLDNIVKLNLMGSYVPLWLSYGANAFYFVTFKNYFDRLPKEIFDAAEIDGCGRLAMFFKIVVPMSLPIIAVVAIFTINASWSDFLLPYLVLQMFGDKQTLMVRIYTYSQSSTMVINQMLMLLSISIVPVVIIFGFCQKLITGNANNTGIKG